ncbi:hypothetical protein JL720_10923 [Aureococcus anophagefferens]|nr:hypothetical protein JL720_10923 [Aureococcus anophagefferens]
MRYVSSRGASASVSFEEAIGSGYAADGGLYVPETLPPITADDLEAWKNLDFPALAVEVLRPFVAGEIPDADLEPLLAACYGDFLAPEKIPVVPLATAPRVAVAELFHGPTFCFKDLGLQVSALQRRQMTTHGSSSVRVATFEGGGDDMDEPIRRMGLDNAFASAHGLCGANSYNVGRPLAQMVHYVWIWLRCRDSFGAGAAPSFVLDVVVPTGAMGNLAAATLAKRRGLPLGAICAGTNANDISCRAINDGDFSRARAPEMKKTLSDAINIQRPYNFERVFYYATGGDASKTGAAMAAGDFRVDPATRGALRDGGYRAARVDDGAMLAALRAFRDAHGYVCDPHTAVAVAAADELGYAPYGGPAAEPRPVAILATAHPCKFQAAVTEALGADAWAAYEARAGESLGAAQRRWETVLRAVLEDPDGLHYVESVCHLDDGDDDDPAADEPPAVADSSCAIL